MEETTTTPASAGGKRSRLDGGAVSEEALASSDAVLTGSRGHAHGLEQFFSPPEAATLAAAVLGDGPNGPAVLDPTAGNGALLAGFPGGRRYGIELDRDQVEAGHYTALRGDLQRLYPLLRLAGARFGALACNPPFGLRWADPATGREHGSVTLCLRFALGLMADHGQGLLIAGRDRFQRELAGAPDAAGVYATVDCDGLFDGVELACTLVFFVAPRNRHAAVEPLRLSSDRAGLAALAERITAHRAKACRHVTSFARGERDQLVEAFVAAQREHDRRLAHEHGRRSRHDLSLRGGRLRCHPSAFAKLALHELGLLRQVQGLDGNAIHYFALNVREWRAVEQAAKDGALTLDPELPARVAEVIAAAERQTCPLYEVKPQMRLGFLADLEQLRCRADDRERGFTAGETYPLHTRSRVHTENGEKLVESRSGERELRRFERERKLLEITVGGERFDEAPESIAYLCEHFELPDPGDLAARYPAEVEQARRDFQAIARDHDFAYKAFQLEDLARLLVKGSGVLAWEQGLGKSLGQLSLAQACAGRGAQDAALFVVPQDLIPQWQREAKKFFERQLQPIDGPASAHAVARKLRGGGTGWYVTHYEALSRTGRRDEPLPEAVVRWSEPDGHGIRAAELTSADVCRQCLADGWAGWRAGACRRCGYVHKRLRVRPAASYLASAFARGVICVDELSLIRGDESLRSRAIRGLRARHRFGATGTPISNYVNDAFWGLWWALGNASQRFPYDYDGKPTFERDFCVIEYLMGHKEGETHQRKRRKVLPEVTNLSLLWRLLSPSMARRRKEDTGEPLVERVFHPTRVPFGARQLELHKTWLARFTHWFEQTHPDSPLVQAGVVEQFAAGLGQLPKLEYAATLPGSDPDLAWTGVEASDFTPKTLKVLELCLQRVRAGDKVLVGSCLIETGRFLAARLCERGVGAVHIVEERQGRAQTKNPRKRAAELRAFVEGDAQVLCAGVQAIKLGHNLDTASAVILDGLPWSHEALDQFLARVHRLTSTRPVSVYVVLTRGSLDERKWELLIRKGQAAELALDGQLVPEPERPVDWSEVLRDMRAVGVHASGDELDEADLEALWARAEGSLAPFAAPVIDLSERLTDERSLMEARTGKPREDEAAQLAFDLAA